MQAIRSFVESNFSLVLFVFFLAGLLVPGFDLIPKSVVLWLLGSVIFLSCANINMADIKATRLRECIIFASWRYAALPVLAFGIAYYLLPDFKEGIFLLALVPAGVTAPAFTNIMGGRTALSLMIVLFSSLLAPFYIPLLFSQAAGETVSVDSFGLFRTIALTVVLPILAWLLIFRRQKTVKSFCQKNSKLLSIILISLVITLVVAKEKEMFWTEPFFVLEALIISSSVFIMFCISAYFVSMGQNFETRKTIMVNSMIPNTALGIGLALIFFPGPVSLFLVISEVPWMLSISSLPFIMRFLEKKS